MIYIPSVSLVTFADVHWFSIVKFNYQRLLLTPLCRSPGINDHPATGYPHHQGHSWNHPNHLELYPCVTGPDWVFLIDDSGLKKHPSCRSGHVSAVGQ